jgi:hypothetical protein
LESVVPGLQLGVVLLVGLLFQCFGGSAAAQTPPCLVFQGLQSQLHAPTGLASVQAKANQLRQAWLAAGHSAEEAQTPPVITSGRILTPTINVQTAPATPKTQIQFKTFSADLAFVYVEYCSSKSVQLLAINYATAEGAPVGDSNPLTIEPAQSAFNLYSAPGVWTLFSIIIIDQAGNETAYGFQQLSTMFPSTTINVVNAGTPDITPPVILSGKISTPVVTLSGPHPAFGVSLTISDDLSGVGYANVYVFGPTNLYERPSSIPVAIKHGVVTAWDYLGPSSGAVPGTYRVETVQICDVAGNCVNHSDPSYLQSLFGTTTFTVKE